MERTPQHRNRYTPPAQPTRGRDFSRGVRFNPAPSPQPNVTPLQPATPTAASDHYSRTDLEGQSTSLPIQYPAEIQRTPPQQQPHTALTPQSRAYMQSPQHQQAVQMPHRIVAAPAPPPPFNPPTNHPQPGELAPHPDTNQMPTQPEPQLHATSIPRADHQTTRSNFHYVGPPHHDYQRYTPESEPSQQEFETIDFEPPEAKRIIHFSRIRNKVDRLLAGYRAYYAASPRRTALVAVSSVLVFSAVAWTLALQSPSANQLLAKTPFSFLLINQGNNEGEVILIDEERPTPEQISEHRAPAKNPRYMSIPKFNLFSRVLSLESKSDGIELPYNIYDIGWSTQSKLPNDPTGTQLYIGHTKGLTKDDAAFARLTELKEGDEIMIETGDGTKYTYVVVYTEKANVSSPNISRYYNSRVDGKPGLNLLTTSGVDPSKENPSENRYATYAVFSILKQ